MRKPTRAYHIPRGDPCEKCDLPEDAHRASHTPDGDPCKSCGLAMHNHRVKHIPSGDPCRCGVPKVHHLKRTRTRFEKKQRNTRVKEIYYVGIDGEGQGREDHLYTLLAWSNKDGSTRQYIEAAKGQRLTTVECLEFILDIPNSARPFAFAFNYDLTKILTDLDDKSLYFLFRPELRQRKPGYEKFGPRPVIWEGYSLNLIGTMFSVKKGKTRRVIWDVFKFFQSKFTTALEDWKVGEKERLQQMREMKDKRSEFDKLSRDDIRAYCFDECMDMAALVEKLVDAHEQVGLHLTKFYGAGSTGGALLRRMGIDKVKRSGPDEIVGEVASAFFGGRFENSVIGKIEGAVWGYDISSAYPYQLYFLPCLECGHWRKTRQRKDLDKARTALVRYSLGPAPRGLSWGPFPFRLPEGSITFPSTSGGGWVWMSEFLAGERLFPHVQFHEAWVYECDCDHRPFADIPQFYLERLRIGKEGPGIVIKLGCNSCYGKLAQSIGTAPPFQSWIWAGLITSGTRAQILDLLGLHRDPSNMLMVATDGIYTREKIEAPAPELTVNESHFEIIQEGPERDRTRKLFAEKPLGGWERKVVDKGMFAARPGIYFPLDPTDDELKQVRARGVGRAAMLAAWRKMVDAWEAGEPSVQLTNVSRFNGAKTCITRRMEDGKIAYRRSERFGQWTNRPIELSFTPLPKRARVNRDGKTLALRQLGKDETSAPYNRSMLSLDAISLKIAALEAMEQPDGDDFSEYDAE